MLSLMLRQCHIPAEKVVSHMCVPLTGISHEAHVLSEYLKWVYVAEVVDFKLCLI